MAGKERPSIQYIIFLAAMLLLILIGVFMLVYGSLHNGLPVPELTGEPLFAARPLPSLR